MKKSTAEKILALLEKGWKAKEIAEKLNVSPAYVYVTKSKASKVDDKAEKAKTVGNKPMTKKELDAWGDEVLKAAETPDMVNHPPHYTVGGIETIDFIEAKTLGYNLGNAVKYIARAYWKGNPLQDLQKAEFYLKREIEKLSELTRQVSNLKIANK